MIDTNKEKSEALSGPRKLQLALEETRDCVQKTLKESDPVLSDVMGYLADSDGKQIRAALLLAAAADDQGEVSHDAVMAAAALEILHLATLVLDDIIDDAPTRRGRPSVQEKFGKKTAVISGDYLFSVSFSLVAGLSVQFPRHINLFTRAISDLCRGELSQHRHNRDTDLSVLSYLRIFAGKTAALFTLALYAGAMLRGDDEQQCRQMGRIGYQIGILFQLIDDCLDYEETPATLRKSTKHDLSEGVITLPLIYAMQKKPDLKKLVGREMLTADDFHMVISDVMRLGGLRHARQISDKYYRKACFLLEQTAPPLRRALIRSLLDQIHSRRH